MSLEHFLNVHGLVFVFGILFVTIVLKMRSDQGYLFIFFFCDLKVKTLYTLVLKVESTTLLLFLSSASSLPCLSCPQISPAFRKLFITLVFRLFERI